MKVKLLLTILLFKQLTAFTQNPKREVRAAWITTHLSLDWPTMADNIATKKSKLITMISGLEAVGINTIYFQVRSVADAFYPSIHAPWSNRLTGATNYGVDPGWDPLQFAIDECHKRGIEIHAWLNPYRAATDEPNILNYSATHKAKTNPEWLLEQVSGAVKLKYFNPALEAVRAHIDDVVKELVTNYDLDGIHFDDYFYYSGLGSQDATQFAADPRGFLNVNDWRRDNVTLLISRLNNSIKTLKPWVKFGISPSGIYKNFKVPGTSITTTGSEHYSTQYADTQKWMNEGLIDYIVPQVYWAFSQTAANAKFNYVTDNWNSMNFSRHLFIGLATYRIKDGSASAYVEDEISNQLDYLRTTITNSLGAAHFRGAHTLTTNAATGKSIQDIKGNQYSTPALIPVMNWIDDIAPEAPSNLITSLENGKTKLNWTAPTATNDELQKVMRYAIYRSTNPTIDFNNAQNLIAVISSNNTTYTDTQVTPGLGTPYYYAVKSLDRMSNESTHSNTVLPVDLIDFTAKKDKHSVKLTWSTSNEINNDYFLLERASDEVNFSLLNKQNAKPSSNKIKSYSFIDAKPLNGINYYRLTQVDKNGTVGSPTHASVQFNELIIFGVKAFPNPTSNKINFSVENYAGQEIKATLANINGLTVHQEKFAQKENTTTHSLKLNAKPPKGTYILTLQGTNLNKTIKVIVL